jgi:hypothetical protein
VIQCRLFIRPDKLERSLRLEADKHILPKAGSAVFQGAAIRNCSQLMTYKRMQDACQAGKTAKK